MTVYNETQEQRKARAKIINEKLKHEYPNAKTALKFKTPYQLLIATILSAQCTDKRVNMVTPTLFHVFPTVQSLASARQPDVEKIIRSTGFYKVKAKNLISLSRVLVEKYNGKVPNTLKELTLLPGVGRKTANCVLGGAFGKAEGIVVDTHVRRVSYRLGLTTHTSPIKVESDLMVVLPKKDWYTFSNRIIEHGRTVCKARNPNCDNCILEVLCPKSGLNKK
ncbi:MAG: endonuclease III [Bacteroidetes bacterium]|nr:endonuclease III [Bacteroidota bacterium]